MKKLVAALTLALTTLSAAPAFAGVHWSTAACNEALKLMNQIASEPADQPSAQSELAMYVHCADIDDTDPERVGKCLTIIDAQYKAECQPKAMLNAAASGSGK